MVVLTMYYEHFGLKQNPFLLDTDAQCVFTVVHNAMLWRTVARRLEITAGN